MIELQLTHPLNNFTWPLPQHQSNIWLALYHCITALVSHLTCSLPPHQSVIPRHCISQSFDLPSATTLVSHTASLHEIFPTSFTMLPCYRITASPHYHVTASLHHHITASLCHHITALLHHCMRFSPPPLPHYHITILLHYLVTASPHYHITTLPHHHITASLCEIFPTTFTALPH